MKSMVEKKIQLLKLFPDLLDLYNNPRRLEMIFQVRVKFMPLPPATKELAILDGEQQGGLADLGEEVESWLGSMGWCFNNQGRGKIWEKYGKNK